MADEGKPDPWQVIREAYDRLSAGADSNYGRSPAMACLDMLGVPQEWRREPPSPEERARRKAKNKRRAATRFRAREFRRMQANVEAAIVPGEIMFVPYSKGEPRRLADASVSAADRPAGPAASLAEVSPVPEADAIICHCGKDIRKLTIVCANSCWNRLIESEKSSDMLAAIREIARK